LKIKKRIIPIVLFFALIASSIAVGQWKVSAAADVTPPYISGISVDYSKVCSGQDVTITVDATDDSGKVDHAYVEYLSPYQDYIYYAYLYPDANGKLVATMPITSEDELGVYKPLYIAASDAAGNVSEVYNVDFYSTGDRRAMVWGNFEVTTFTQTPPRGLSSVNVTTHAGSDGKITGTSILMEYAKQYSLSYTPAPGKEITGLSEGMYEVRYASKDGLPAGPSTLVYVKGPEFDVYNGVLLKYNGPGGDVVIPDNMGITSIGYQAFFYCSSLKSVTMPDSITSLGGRAFGESSISSINLSKNLTSIGSEAFRNCKNLTYVALPSGVASIGSAAFTGCINISSLILPDSLTSIGNFAFSDCDSLTSIDLPSGLTKIESDTFYSCSKLTSISLPEGLTKIDSFAFSNCSSLTSIAIPEGVTRIERDTFYWCKKLESVSLPSSLTFIDDSGFNSCSALKSLTIPPNVTYIGGEAFALCTSLTTIYAYPMTAPAPNSSAFRGVPASAVLYKIPSAAGYDAAPWSSFVSKYIAPDSIELTTTPLKTEYYTGQSINLAGIVVTGTYGNIKAQTPVTLANISGFNSSTPANGQKVTVNVDGKTATFDVNITDKAFAPQGTGDMAQGKAITSSSALINGAYATDVSISATSYANLATPGLQWVQVDLGETKNINEIGLWHYFGDTRAYHDVIVQLSDDSTFATGVTTVYNNDRDNSAKLGAGTDYEYAETIAGMNIAFNTAKARYVRIYSNGSTANSYNHYSEILISGELPIVPAESVSLNKASAEVGTGETYALAANFLPSNTTNKGVTWSSSDESIATVSSAGVVTGVKPGTAIITATTVDGGFKATCEMTVTLAPSKLSTGKAVTTSLAFNNAGFVTDGYKGTDKYSDSVNSGLQYVQIDLGAYYDLTKVNLWHYFGDGRTYKDVVVRVSNDPTFATEATTVFNNDKDNTAGFGIGAQDEYPETSAGKTITFDKVNARYVRIYSGGSSANGWNHVVEAEVYGYDGPAVSAASVSLNKTADTIAVGATTALTAKIMPLNTTNKNVTWSSSDTSMATVNSSGVVTGAKVGTATITATAADGSSQKAECTVTVTEPVGNLAAGKTVTSSAAFTSLAAANDGYKNTDQFAGSVGSGLSWIQVDMGASLDVNHVNLWHYFGDGRTYHDVIVQFSDDPNFVNNVTTVYNNDANNSALLGGGKDTEYAETSAGKSIDFSTVKARYARIYSNGSTANGWNHVVEVEISKEVQRTNYTKGAAATTSSSFKNLNVATDNSLNTGYADGSSGLHWIQYDLGAQQDINEINLWHYFLDGRTYHDVIVQVSNDPTFATGVKTVYSNDANNSAGLGAGSDAEYAETSAGKSITFPTEKAQYVRLYSNGSSINTYNHYVEVEICNNLASGLQTTSSPGFTSLNVINDGLKTGYSNGSTGLQWIQYDLGSVQDINEVNLWHYYLDGRTYHDVIVQVSNDPDFETGVTTVYNNDTNNSALLGAGSDSEYAETAAGKKISFSTKKAQYVRIYSNGSSINAYNHYVEVEICNNLAAGKTAAATSSAFTNMGSLTDGNKSSGYAEGLISGLQWVQLDLGAAKSINRINLWHYFLDGRTYHDVIVQVSNDPTFSTGVKTVFNNDKDNSAGFGAGSDSEYAETSAGKTIDFSAADAQYVRIYSNGSTANGWNHLVEVEVLGN